MKSNKGISLIVLVITIIVLIVLAGVAVANLSGNNSVISKAQEGKAKSDLAKADEESKISEYEEFLSSAKENKNNSEEDSQLWLEKLGYENVNLNVTYKAENGEGNIDTIIISDDGGFYYDFGDEVINLSGDEINEYRKAGYVIVSTDYMEVIPMGLVLTFSKENVEGNDVYKIGYQVEGTTFNPFVAQD